MTTFDNSPRATKRQKTNPHDSPNLPLPSRAFRAVKEAVFGRSSLKSNPRSRDVSGSTGQAMPVKSGHSIDYEQEEIVNWDVPDSDDEDTSISVRPARHTSGIRGTSVRQTTREISSSTKRSTGRGGKARLVKEELRSPVVDGPKILATPRRTELRSYKLRSASQDHDELEGEPRGKGAANTSERLQSDANGIGKAHRGERQQPGKAGARRKSRDSATPDLSREYEGLRASSDNAAGHESGSEDLEHPDSVRPSKTLCQRPPIQPVVSDEFVKVNQTPTSQPRRKRGLEEVARIDIATVDGAPATPTGRKRGRPRKQIMTATVVPDGRDDDMAIKELPSRHGSLDALFRETSIGNNITTIEEICPPASTLTSPGRKRRGATKATIDNLVPGKTTPRKNVVGSVSDIDTEDSTKAYVKELRKVLENDAGRSLTGLKMHIMDRLTGKRRLALVNLEEEYQKVYQLVEQTVLAGEGNSMLVIGSRGTAKTLLVETVIGELAIDHSEEYHVVRLNGFIHTDDKLALREIWRQLGREMEVEDDAMAGRSNYADTLTSLLALLSHSAETSEGEQDHVAKSVIFVIDEFDLFASHPRQTLLYNLFDVAQSRNAPIAVLGLTTKVDVVESLEKRVKSRFGQRYIHLSLPKNYAAFQDICKSALICQPPTGSTRLNHEDAKFQQLHTSWTKYVNALFTDDHVFDAFLFQIYILSKSVPSFLTACLLPVSLLSPTRIPTGLDFTTQTFSPPDSKLHLLSGLSDLELSLLIAAARLDIILDTDMCNFSMAYDEYQQLASRVKAQSSAAGQTAVGGGARVWGREVASGAWEHLAELELILTATGGGGKGDISRANGRMWRVDVGLEEIGPSVNGMGGVMAKWCREI